MAKKARDEYVILNVHVHSFMSRTVITLKFKNVPVLHKASYRAEKLLINVNLPPLMPDEDDNFGGSLGLDK